MLHVLPPEVTLSVLSHLPISSLLSLQVLSYQWLDFFTANQSVIFHGAALLHGYIQPGTMFLEDVLFVNMGRPWAGSTSWKDFCYRSIQLRKNWEGKGRAVAYVLSPPGFNVHRIKVDEKAGICIMTCIWGGLSVVHLFSGILLWYLPQSYVRPHAHCEYDNGYLVFDRDDGSKEVWRLASGFTTDDEVAPYAPPEAVEIAVSAHAAALNHQYAPRGHFRPWALLRFHEPTHGYRLAYPTLICASHERAFLHDVHTGSLVQTIDMRLRDLRYVDVNERHAFVCESDAVHVFSRESGNEVLCIPTDASVQCSRRVGDPSLISGDWFITPLSVYPEIDESRPLPDVTIAAHVSRDGRDLVVLSEKRRVMFIRDFERICRGETSLEQAGLVLGIPPEDTCHYLGFEHGRVCVATIRGLYVFTFGADLSARAAFVRPSENALARSYISCMQLTDRRIYFTWEDSRRRQDITLFEDAENAQELPRPNNTNFRSRAPSNAVDGATWRFNCVYDLSKLLPTPKLGRLLYYRGVIDPSPLLGVFP
ncbi:hypothetical protein EDB84DRAFT_1436286 [Lactarius hengduanensis]|nr:hypothetical protein EDB84DRAFT_1436286 [Lactarius hengduanensis]